MQMQSVDNKDLESQLDRHQMIFTQFVVIRMKRFLSKVNYIYNLINSHDIYCFELFIYCRSFNSSKGSPKNTLKYLFLVCHTHICMYIYRFRIKCNQGYVLHKIQDIWLQGILYQQEILKSYGLMNGWFPVIYQGQLFSEIVLSYVF